MGKSALIKKIHNAAVNYQKYLAGRTFLYVYDDSVVEIVFKSSSFQHLTGVKTNLKAKGFYAHAKKKNGLRPGEVMFDKTHPYDLAEKKMDYLGDLYKVTCSDVMIATDIVTISAGDHGVSDTIKECFTGRLSGSQSRGIPTVM